LKEALMKTIPIKQHAEEVASKLPALLVEADRIAATVAQGVHGRRRNGQGDAFWQFRPYQQGEPSRRIDWRQSAKTQNYYVREREWEASQTVWLWCDQSASMDYSGDANRTTKSRRANVLCLALASLLIKGGEQIALLGDPHPPGSGQAALHRLANMLETKNSDTTQSLPQHEHLPRYTELVLIGDFLSPLEEIQSALKRYSLRHVRGHLLQILDPSEESLPFEGRVQFDGLENEDSIYFGNVAAIRNDYRNRLSMRKAALSELTHKLGWNFQSHTTDRSAQSALLQLYQSISHQRID
jgi:uncharacterized protein (DUF58 family)